MPTDADSRAPLHILAKWLIESVEESEREKAEAARQAEMIISSEQPPEFSSIEQQP